MNHNVRFIGLLRQEFESSAYLTPQFAHFYRIFANDMRKLLKDLFAATEIDVHRGHFDASGFFRLPRGAVYYFSTGDVRVRWHGKGLLIRTARDFKDYTGGSNCEVPTDSGASAFVDGLTRIVRDH